MAQRARMVSTTHSRREYGDLSSEEQTGCASLHSRASAVFVGLDSLRMLNSTMLLAPVSSTHIDGDWLVIPIQNLNTMASQRELSVALARYGDDVDLSWNVKQQTMRIRLPSARKSLNQMSPLRKAFLMGLALVVVMLLYQMALALFGKQK